MYERITLHVYTYEAVIPHVSARHVRQQNVSCHTYEWVTVAKEDSTAMGWLRLVGSLEL